MRCFGYNKNDKDRCKNSTKLLFCHLHKKKPIPYFINDFYKVLFGMVIMFLTFSIFISDSFEAISKFNNSLQRIIGNENRIEIVEREIDKFSHQIILTNNSKNTVLITEIRLRFFKFQKLYAYSFAGCANIPETKYDFAINPKRDSLPSIMTVHSLLPNETDNFLFHFKWSDQPFVIKYRFEFLNNKKLVATSKEYLNYGSCGLSIPDETYLFQCPTMNDTIFDLNRYYYSCRTQKMDSIINQVNSQLLQNNFNEKEVRSLSNIYAKDKILKIFKNNW